MVTPSQELCAAVLAVEVAEMVVANMDIEFDTIKFYTDSKVVLGYIYNQTRRFYIYVENRVERIRKSTVPEQWNFVPTTDNPADQATRSIPSVDIANSSWMRGPIHFLERDCEQSEMVDNFTVLVEPDADKEIRPVTVGKTEIEDSQTCIGSKQFEKFSSWTRLVRAIAVLLRAIRARKQKIKFQDVDVVSSLYESESLIVKTGQWEAFKPEITSLKRRQSLPRKSSIIMLDPYLDNDGNLRVGGRLNKSKLIPFRERNPIILLGKCHVSKLIASHTHAQVKHQGRHLTEGTIRSKGYWIVGMKRLVSSIIHHCIQCRNLRRTTEVQKMADLPTERIEPAPPFTNVGVDVFGPWLVIQRKTRGDSANAKRLAVIFTCLTTRTVHIEVISEMSSNAFINAMRRFVAIRGQVSIFRSDRGTNFVGATDSLHINAINVEGTQVKRYMQESRTVWIFNPPHASHMGGAWERLIGVTRRILDAMLLETKKRYLTHDVLVTFMAEVSSILNHRPIVPISSDVDNPFVLSPAVLLTQKTILPQQWITQKSVI